MVGLAGLLGSCMGWVAYLKRLRHRVKVGNLVIEKELAEVLQSELGLVVHEEAVVFRRLPSGVVAVG